MTIASVPSTQQSDADLASRFAREAEPMFEVLSRGARRLTRSEADAEDLLQDTLLDAYAGFHTFRDGSNLKAWLFRILYNRWVSTYRAKQRRPVEVSDDKITERDLVGSASRASTGMRSAEDEVLEGLPDNEIQAAMDSLPEGFRTVVYYADVQGYTYAETAAILNIPHGTVMSRVSRGRQRLRIALAHVAGGGVLTARDHEHLGRCLLRLGSVGSVNQFHDVNVDPATMCDDQDTPTISWPNYHSGANGDYQPVFTDEPVHELLRSTRSASGRIEWFPAHPHEGLVSADVPFATVLAQGRSIATDRRFNLAVVLDGERALDGRPMGRALAESTFHHFADYNWDVDCGAPSFVSEPPGTQIKSDPQRLAVFTDYVRNIATWLEPGSERFRDAAASSSVNALRRNGEKVAVSHVR